MSQLGHNIDLLNGITLGLIYSGRSVLLKYSEMLIDSAHVAMNESGYFFRGGGGDTYIYGETGILTN
jgi:hypothetical protein